MAVEANQLDVRCIQHIAHAIESEILEHGETELGILASGLDVLMRVGFDTRRDAHEHLLRLAHLARDARNAAQLDAGVKDDAPHPSLDCFAQLALCLVVAMNEHALHRETHCTGAGKFAAARHVEKHAFFVRNAQDFLVEERFRSVQRFGVRIALVERLAVLLHTVTQIGFVEHVEGRPLLAGKVDHVDSAD